MENIENTENVINPQEKIEVIGVKFKEIGKTYYFSPKGLKFHVGEHVIVPTSRGTEFGTVSAANKFVFENEIISPLREIDRLATKEDVERFETNKVLEGNAFNTCLELIAKHKLDMKLVEAEYTFDNSKLLFYFTSDGRVDFRQLVKDLAQTFRTRIELRQIGIRDEAKMMGGLGVCGRELCCAAFLSDFGQVSIKMAKEQNLSLNSAKISGTCGRLMCCLKYENEAYKYEISLTPPVDAKVRTPDGVGYVKDSAPLSGMCKVILTDNDTVKTYHRDKLTVLSKPKIKEAPAEENENE